MIAWTVILIGMILAAGLIRKAMNDSKEMECKRLEWRASGGFHALIEVRNSHVICSCGQVFASELSMHGAIAQWNQHVDVEALGGLTMLEPEGVLRQQGIGDGLCLASHALRGHRACILTDTVEAEAATEGDTP